MTTPLSRNSSPLDPGRSSIERPPAVIGYRERPFLTTGAATRYYCGIDRRRVDWPTVMVPIWRGEVPKGVKCAVCGLALEELE